MNSDNPIRFLSSHEVREALGMPDAIAAMRRAFEELAGGHSLAPQRIHMVSADDPAGDVLVMPSYSPVLQRAAVKTVTVFPGNRQQGLPLIHGIVLLLDAANGRPLAILDGSMLTAIRTGATSGLATDLFARADASVVAIFGAGIQARTQLEAVCAVRPVTDVRIYDVNPAAADTFAGAVRDAHGIPARACASSADALRGAQVVCTATTATQPVFDDGELSPGVHINAIGSYKPHVQEIPGETVRRARVAVDQREAAWQEAGDLIAPLKAGLVERSHVVCELGEAITENIVVRRSDQDITLFKSVGVAVQDLAAATCCLAAAEARGLGTQLAL